MVVSDFEIQRTRDGQAIHDTRYRLQITNLEEQEIEFILESHITPPEGISAPFGYLQAALQDSISWASSPHGTLRAEGPVYVLSLPFRIGPQLSATYELNTRTVDDTVLRGFTVLRVPTKRRQGGLSRWSLGVAQLDHPVRVLLDASRHEFRDGFSGYVQDLEGRSVYRTTVGDWASARAIAISSGRAENEIPPEEFSIGSISKFEEHIHRSDADASAFRGAQLLPLTERIPALLDLLGAVKSDAASVRTLNTILQEIGTDVRLCPPDPAQFITPQTEQLERDILTAINAHREGQLRTALALDPACASAAREHSIDMAADRVPLGHDGLDERFAKASAGGRSPVGETTAAEFTVGTEVVNGWLNDPSPLYKAIIEGPATVAGVGVARSPAGTNFITAIFAI
jgi:uncharacterized protein YkwD